MIKIQYKKSVSQFGYVYYFGGINHHTIRLNVHIQYRSKMEYPYRLEVDGNYKGDFKTLNAAKDYAAIEVNNLCINYDQSKGY